MTKVYVGTSGWDDDQAAITEFATTDKAIADALKARHPGELWVEEIELLTVLPPAVEVLYLTSTMDSLGEETHGERTECITEGITIGDWIDQVPCSDGHARVTPKGKYNLVSYVEYTCNGTDHAAVRASHAEQRVTLLACMDAIVGQAELQEERDWMGFPFTAGTAAFDGSIPLTPVQKAAAWIPVSREMLDEAEEFRAGLHNAANTTDVDLLP